MQARRRALTCVAGQGRAGPNDGGAIPVTLRGDLDVVAARGGLGVGSRPRVAGHCHRLWPLWSAPRDSIAILWDGWSDLQSLGFSPMTTTAGRHPGVERSSPAKPHEACGGEAFWHPVAT